MKKKANNLAATIQGVVVQMKRDWKREVAAQARNQTRRERYDLKQSKAISYPISLAAINFMNEDNLAFTLRAAVCFGIKDILLLGECPDRRRMNQMSGTMFDYVNIIKFKRPNDLLEYTKKNNIKLISLELPGDYYKSTSIYEYKYDFSQPVCILTGNESSGVSLDILMNSDVVYIPMPGTGFCLNTSQAGTIALYEAIRQYESQQNRQTII